MGCRKLSITYKALIQFDRLIADRIALKFSPEKCMELSEQIFQDFFLFLEERGFILDLNVSDLNTELLIKTGNVLQNIVFYDNALDFGLYLIIRECVNIETGGSIYILTEFTNCRVAS